MRHTLNTLNKSNNKIPPETKVLGGILLALLKILFLGAEYERGEGAGLEWNERV